MHSFADFAEELGLLDGDKIRIESVLNKELVVIGHAVRDSQFSKNKSGKYLTLQIELGGERRVVFTGSDVLIEQLEKYAEMIPFAATIIKVDKFYTLS